ncbi:MAG: hypothetical protein SVU69_08100 [Pseudomonadota bacterium]|nr:hypothetical protein [Pseudomonadota bacterium]
MDILAVVIFAAVAGFGSLMTLRIARKDPIPGNWPVMHAIAGGAGLIVLLMAQLSETGNMMGWIAFGIFAAAMVGGAFLFGIVYRGKERPLIVALAHGSLGYAGLIALLLAVFG